MNKGRTVGTGSALLANIIFGFSFLFSKAALEIAHPLIILSVRFTAAFIALSILLVLGAFKVSFRGKRLGRLFLMSIAQPLLYFLFELYGLKLTSSAISGIIIALVPVGVTLLSGIALKEKPTLLQIIFSVISLLGVAAVSLSSSDGSKSSILGIVLLFGAVASSCTFNLLSRKCSESFSVFERTYFMFLISAVGFNIISAAVLGGGYIDGIKTAFSSSRFIISVGYLALLSSVGAFMLYNYSTSKITAICSSSFSNIITVISVLAGIFILGERLSVLQLILCVPVIIGVLGVNISGIKKE